MLHRNYYTLQTLEFAIFLMSFLSIRPDYDTWLRVISSLGANFEDATILTVIIGILRRNDKVQGKSYYIVEHHMIFIRLRLTMGNVRRPKWVK